MRGCGGSLDRKVKLVYDEIIRKNCGNFKGKVNIRESAGLRTGVPHGSTPDRIPGFAGGGGEESDHQKNDSRKAEPGRSIFPLPMAVASREGGSISNPVVFWRTTR
jgi:hypothetical protein